MALLRHLLIYINFPEYKDRILQVIRELNTEDLICPVCLDEMLPVFRNCINCTCYACKACWGIIPRCLQCNLVTLKWDECISLEMLNLIK